MTNRSSAGEGAGPSTLAVERSATPSASRRGEPAPAEHTPGKLKELPTITCWKCGGTGLEREIITLTKQDSIYSQEQPEKAGAPSKDQFIADAIPIIQDWFCRLPTSFDDFVFESSDAERLAAVLWDNLSPDIVSSRFPICSGRT